MGVLPTFLPRQVERLLAKAAAPLKFKAAFRHRTTGEVIPTGAFHDVGRIPDEWTGPCPACKGDSWPGGIAAGKPCKFCGGKGDAAESGFVDEGGKFYGRQEASRAINPQLAYQALDAAQLEGDHRTAGDVFRAPKQRTAKSEEPSGEDLEKARAPGVHGLVSGVPRPLSHDEATSVVAEVKKNRIGPGQARWDVLHASLKAGDPEAFEYARDLTDPKKVAVRRRALQSAAKKDAEEAAYQGQAVELADLHPDEFDRHARGKDVWLYHGTSSKFVPQILREGLRYGVNRVDVHNTVAPGVRLTARPGGSSNDGGTATRYAQGAVAQHGGHPVVLRVRMPYDHLEPDTDDEDLSVARHQFIVPHVPLDRIHEVNGKRTKPVVKTESVAKVEPALSSADVQAAVKVLGRLLETLAPKEEPLTKATRPEDFKAVAGAIDKKGAAVVDHAPHLQPLPAHAAEVEHYRKAVLGPGAVVKRKAIARGTLEGVTKKQIYEVPHPDGTTRRYMVKPYHERAIARTKQWVKHPIQGWAEMANQALYHAAGIGHLHQRVHVDEHDMGAGHEKEPALVVHMADGHIPAADRRLPLLQEGRDAVHKIALMDFLTGNLDRHGGNLLIPYDGKSAMAIDHSRSFQYARPATHKWMGEKEFKEKRRGRYEGDVAGEQLGMYTGGDGKASTAISRPEIGGPKANFPNYDEKMKFMQEYEPIVNEWWAGASPKVREEMGRQIQQIKDPKVRDHVKRNFEARADLLDGMARDGFENYGDEWYKQTAPHYLPGEQTDEERQRAAWEREQGGK